MPDIQAGLVHIIKKERCGNCGLLQATHANGECLFDSTQFREESASDHLDCECETVTEISDPVISKDGTLTVNGVVQRKEILEYVIVSFTV
jgi:hypothetical protein